MACIQYISPVGSIDVVGMVGKRYFFANVSSSDFICRNMFLAASPYFQHRFSSSPELLRAFPPTLLSVSCVTNLVSMGVLTNLQSNANYPRRIILSLLLNIAGFTLLALSTVTFRDVSPGVYFAFLMIIVFTSSFAAGLSQNGVFAYVTGFGVGEYVQAIMTGQAVAGVLPPIAQIVSVLSVPPPKTQEEGTIGHSPQESGKSAFAYFLTATAVSTFALLAFLLLLRLERNTPIEKAPPFSDASAIPEDTSSTALVTSDDHNDDDEDDDGAHKNGHYRKAVPLWPLFLKLRYIALAVFLTFGVTMFFPVYTQEIISTHPLQPPPPRLLQTACFIPLAFLFWNTGDLLGRLLTLVPSLAAVTKYPLLVFVLSILRVVWIPLYLLCNIHGKGAIVASDFFYLVIVQFLFGVSNGYLGSCCMMGAGDWVDEEEREAAGGFMGLCLVGGLTVGSLASFGVA